MSGDKAYGLNDGLLLYDQRDFDNLSDTVKTNLLTIEKGIKDGTLIIE